MAPRGRHMNVMAHNPNPIHDFETVAGRLQSIVDGLRPAVESQWTSFFNSQERFSDSPLSGADREEGKKQLNAVLDYVAQGRIDSAICLCGRIWYGENERAPPAMIQNFGGLGDFHPVMLVISRIYGSVKYPDLQEMQGALSVNPCFVHLNAMAREYQTQDTWFLQLFVAAAIYWIDIGGYLMLGTAVKFGIRLLDHLQSALGVGHDDCIALNASIAKSLLQRGFDEQDDHPRPGIDSDPAWMPTQQQREAIVQTYLILQSADMSTCPDANTYRLLLSNCAQEVRDGKHETALSSIVELYRVRETLFNERHQQSAVFIHHLLGEFVKMLRQNRNVRLSTWGDHGLMEDLVDFCLQNDMYDNVEVLAREFLAPPGRLIVTDRATESKVFAQWPSGRSSSVQGLLAQDGIPTGEYYYWEDSRLYSHEISNLSLTTAKPLDEFPTAPVKVTITPERALQLDISEGCLLDWYGNTSPEALQEARTRIEKSEVWHLLHRLHKAQDWEIMKALDFQDHHPRCKHRYMFSSDALPHDKICKNMYREPHVIWIFQPELIDAELDADEKPIEPFSYSYRFLLVGTAEDAQWITAKFTHDARKLAASSLKQAFEARGETGVTVYGLNDTWKDGNQPTSCREHGSHYPSQLKFRATEYTWGDPAESLARLRYNISTNPAPLNGSQEGAPIVVTVPTISYEYFQTLRWYRSGVTYKKYMLALKYSLVGYWPGAMTRMDWKQDAISMETRSAVLPVWDLSKTVQKSVPEDREKRQATITRGFFNTVDSGVAVLDPSQDSEAYGLVSSSWIDYKDFMIHELPIGLSSTLTLPDGEPVRVLGYVAGTWTAADLSRQAKGIRVIVVEAKLMYGDQPVNFALSGCFYTGNAKDLSRYEQRVFCGSLNPTLLRYGPQSDNCVAVFYPSKQLIHRRRPDFFAQSGLVFDSDSDFEDSDLVRRQRNQPKEPQLESYSSDEFWDEMIAREVWDRGVEGYQKPYGEAETKRFENWYKKEVKRRQDWDAARKAHKVVMV